MPVDLKQVVRIDQILHGERFIRIEFGLAVPLALAILAVTARMVARHPPSTPWGLLLAVLTCVFFLGLSLNYSVLFWLAHGPVTAKELPDRAVLRSLTLQLSGLILLPGAIAVVAWRQRRSTI
jgi:uncharacterized membrane protein